MRHLLVAAAFLFLACDASSPRVPYVDDGLLRIVVLGDSVAHGAGDERRGGIAAVLQRTLPAANVVNLGIDGARTHDVLARLTRKDARAFIARADVVILSIGGNSIA